MVNAMALAYLDWGEDMGTGLISWEGHQANCLATTMSRPGKTYGTHKNQEALWHQGKYERIPGKGNLIKFGQYLI